MTSPMAGRNMKKIFIVIICLIFMMNISSFDAFSAPCENIFYKNPTQTKRIALTFDDGPHPKYTEKILKILDKYNVKATFFVIGVNAENYPEELKRIFLSGHEIGNHSYSHSSKIYQGNNLENEMIKCEKTIENIIGLKPTLFRPPRGEFSTAIKEITLKNNYPVIMWSIDTRDWAHTSPESILNNIRKNIKGGDIILMHDYISGKNTTCDALNLIIPFLLEKGYEFVTVSELIKA